VSDARWFEVDADIGAATRHFALSVDLYRKGGFETSGLELYQAEMALMHAIQSAHTSLEGGLLRILEMLGEERPVGGNWHGDLIKRVASALPGKRPAILDARLAAAADETRRFRHRAVHNYDTFRVREARRTIKAAELLAKELPAAILAFKQTIDPP
jgi:uncharacterized protein YutE (UPF0331/DUF86 family)